MTYYVDTSVIVPLFVREPTSAVVTDWFSGNAELLAISSLAIGEYYATLSKNVRMKSFSEADALIFGEQFERWRENCAVDVRHQNEDIFVAAQMVRFPLPKLLMPDAIHIATCKRLGLTLATFDKDLAAIAAREGVRCIVPA